MAPEFPVDEQALDLLECAIRPGEGAEQTSLLDFCKLMSELSSSGADPEFCYHPNDVIGALLDEVRRLRAGPDLSAVGGGPEVPPKGDLLAQLDHIHELMTDEDRASFGLEAQGLCDDCRCYERGVAAGRREAAGAIRSEADDEARRPNRGGSSRLVERWLREAARLAEGDTDGT